jgi:hypothetical protein
MAKTKIYRIGKYNGWIINGVKYGNKTIWQYIRQCTAIGSNFGAMGLLESLAREGKNRIEFTIDDSGKAISYK